MPRPQVFFLYRKSRANRGSTFLRGHQLCEVAQRHLGTRFNFAMMPMPGETRLGLQALWAATRPRGAIYLLTKNCVQTLSPRAAAILQRRARGVVFDYVDADMDRVPMQGADIHLASSLAQFDDLKTRATSGTAALLLHGYDARLDPPRAAPADHLRMVYVGAPELAHVPPSLRNSLTMLRAETLDDMPAVLRQIHGFNLHYAIRPTATTKGTAIFKPFTKGATAAACGANILVTRATHDAQALLGADYPYLVDTSDDNDILTRMIEAKAGFGGADWQRAQAVMADLANRVSPAATAQQLGAILTPLAE